MFSSALSEAISVNLYQLQKEEEEEDTMQIDQPEQIFKTFNGHELCSEQKKALELHKKMPVVVVNGPGGSGKTDFLGAIASLYDQEKMLGVAFQAGNAGHLSKIFKNSHTIHQVLWTHRCTCKDSNNPFAFLATQNSSDYQQEKFKKMFTLSDNDLKKKVLLVDWDNLQ